MYKQIGKLVYDAVSLINQLKLGIILYNKNDNYDECISKCNYHSMTEQQQIYFNLICPTKQTNAQKHWLCMIDDNSHPEPSLQSRLSAHYMLQHLHTHSDIVKQHLLLSNAYVQF